MHHAGGLPDAPPRSTGPTPTSRRSTPPTRWWRCGTTTTWPPTRGGAAPPSTRTTATGRGTTASSPPAGPATSGCPAGPTTAPDGRLKAWRSLDLGRLAELVVLDTRTLGPRSPARDRGRARRPRPAPHDARPRPGRRSWPAASSATTAAVGVPRQPGDAPPAAHPRAHRRPGRRRAARRVHPRRRSRVNPDQWDGYATAREDLLRSVGDRGGVVALTGDVHSSWAWQGPAMDGRKPTMVEFVTPSVDLGDLRRPRPGPVHDRRGGAAGHRAGPRARGDLEPRLRPDRLHRRPRAGRVVVRRPGRRGHAAVRRGPHGGPRATDVPRHRRRAHRGPRARRRRRRDRRPPPDPTTTASRSPRSGSARRPRRGRRRPPSPSGADARRATTQRGGGGVAAHAVRSGDTRAGQWRGSASSSAEVSGPRPRRAGRCPSLAEVQHERHGRPSPTPRGPTTVADGQRPTSTTTRSSPSTAEDDLGRPGRPAPRVVAHAAGQPPEPREHGHEAGVVRLPGPTTTVVACQPWGPIRCRGRWCR